MRILLLTTGRQFGGAERQFLNLARGLTLRGHDVMGLLLFRNPHFEGACRAAGVRFEFMDVRGSWDLSRIIVRPFRSTQRFAPDVIYAFRDAANLIAVLLRAFRPSTQVAWGIRNSALDRIRYDRLTRVTNRLQRIAAPLPDLVIANSEAGRRDIVAQGFSERRVALVLNGIDLDHFRRDSAAGQRLRCEWGVGRDERLIGLVARLDPMKDHLTFMRAARQTAVHRNDVRFVCVGDRPDAEYAERLSREAAELNLGARLIWAGLQRDMPAVYSALDVLTLSSAYGEGVPNAVAEAMACGVPCVVTDSGDAARLIGEQGIAVTPNDPGALAGGWLQVLDGWRPDPDGLRKRIEDRYGLESMTEQTERLLSALPRNRGRKASRPGGAEAGRDLLARARAAAGRRLGGRLDPAIAWVTRRPMRFRLAAAGVRRRIDSDRLFVGWLLSGGRSRGSTRVRGLLPHAYLSKVGVHSIVLAKRQEELHLNRAETARIVRAGFDVVVFQGVFGPRAESLARALRATGTKTVYAVGDPVGTGMPELVDWTVVASESLADAIGADCARSSVIEAMIETPSGLCKDYSAPAGAAGIRVVWVGYPENLHLVAPVREALSDHRLSDFELITISRGPQATIQWDRRRVWRQLVDCDIAVLPADETDWYRAKPNTRMIMLKALGLPIVASPIPSYEATLTHGLGCYFARKPREWVDYLRALSDFDRRREMGLAERDAVLATYGPEAIGGRWLELFGRLAGRDAGRPAVAPVPLGEA